MNIAQSIPSSVTSISFSFLTSQDIKRISIKQITNPVLLDDLNRPNVGGLYDPVLGPISAQDICATCRLNYFQCPGHFGHIELPAPVFHPLFMTNMFNILRATCLFCHHFKLSKAQKARFIGVLTLLEHGLLDAAQHLDQEMHQTGQKAGKMEDDDDGEEDYESTEDFEKRINTFVTVSLLRASSSKRDDYKDGQVYQVRKDKIASFLKATQQKKCSNCLAHGFTFRKEGYTKIIEYDLSSKQKEQHQMLNMRRPNVLVRLSKPHEGAPSQAHESFIDSDSDEDMEENAAAPGGHSTFSDQEEDEDEGMNQATGPARAANGKEKSARGRNERIVTAEECRAHLRRLFANDSDICSLLWGRHGPFAPINKAGRSLASADMFFMDVIPVSPTRFRPAAKLGETLFEHPQNELLSKVLKTTYRLRDLNNDLRAASAKDAGADIDGVEGQLVAVDRIQILGRLIESLVQLQIDVNSFMDSNKNPAPVRQGSLPPAGVKQGLEKKEGLFRKHMMGKRVNYAARSVISPDVNLETNEIGIPPVFARTLTFPVPVTDANVAELRALVISGPIWPGASMIEQEDGSLIHLAKMSEEQRRALASQLNTPQDGNRSTQGLSTRTPTVNKKVYRHLRDGDVLLLNRQPTLHKPSMMAHIARVLKGEKTIRMHYANCNSYNADFDGDEMNIHFPQNQIPRAEAMMIANTDNQYLVPTSGEPLRGLIQDHVVAGVWMTNKQTFFSREEYHQILYGALRPEDNYSGEGRVITLPPAIWKPHPMWTGKQIISTIMKNITPPESKGLNLRSKARVPNSYWGPNSKEQEVIFADGELVCGILDKSQFGATSYGFVHAVFELYGPTIAGKLLSILSRLFTKFLQHRGFTCRMDDLALTPAGDAARRKEMANGELFGTEAAIDNFPSLADPSLSEKEKTDGLRARLEEVLRDDNKMAGLDMTVKMKMKTLKKTIDDECIPNGLLRKFPHNHMQAMVMTGAKGSSVNAGQISCSLGQQELEGRRVPVMVSGKTLPSFKAFETAAIAGGYIGSRFLTGLRPQEFYFHCMAGREGLIDTAVKTSRSGYLQRCLIKHLEGIRVHYDHTVRGADSSIFQFQYGGDGLDVTKQKYLLDADKQSQLFEFACQNQHSIAHRVAYHHLADRIDIDTAATYMRKVLKKPMKYDPTLSLYSPTQYLGATSLRFAEVLADYINRNPHGLFKDSKQDGDKNLPRRKRLVQPKNFRRLMHARYIRCLVDPGEAVGLLASQGVGEPSTQMTLNTFHFAGHGAANVTLGIPRLREIVMTASMKPKTPTMTLPLRPGIDADAIDKFCKKASRLTLSEVVDFVTVDESLKLQHGARERTFAVTVELFPRDQYRKEYKVESKAILSALSTTFPAALKREIQVELKKLNTDLKSQAANIGKGTAVGRGGDAAGANAEDAEQGDDVPDRQNDETSEVGDGDADDAKRSRQKVELDGYSSDEDDDDNASQAGRNAMEDLEAEFDDDPEEAEKLTSAKRTRDGAVEAASMIEANASFSSLCNWAVPDSFSFQKDGVSRCRFELKFAAETPKLLLVGIIERTCVKTIIHQIPNITRCLHIKRDDSTPDDEPEKMMTEGSNFFGIWNFAGDAVDVDNISSNDIYAILMTYGVEAARTTIVQEIQSIFRAYKIGVDGRHVDLIADYMTFDGGYKPFNRKGLSSNNSPLLKASYETTASFISDATLHGDFDDLATPSGRVVVGRPSMMGTGAFDVLADFGKTPV